MLRLLVTCVHQSFFLSFLLCCMLSLLLGLPSLHCTSVLLEKKPTLSIMITNPSDKLRPGNFLVLHIVVPNSQAIFVLLYAGLYKIYRHHLKNALPTVTVSTQTPSKGTKEMKPAFRMFLKKHVIALRCLANLQNMKNSVGVGLVVG